LILSERPSLSEPNLASFKMFPQLINYIHIYRHIIGNKSVSISSKSILSSIWNVFCLHLNLWFHLSQQTKS